MKNLTAIQYSGLGFFLVLVLTVFAVVPSGMGLGALASGGWVEPQGTAPRPRWPNAFIQSFRANGPGDFYLSCAIQHAGRCITDASDCGGKDCVWSVGYSYWRNTNAHEGSDEMLIFLGLASNRGGTGPTLFKYNKATDDIIKVGPLFPLAVNSSTTPVKGGISAPVARRRCI